MTYILAIYSIIVALVFCAFIFVENSDDGNITFEIPIPPPMTREITFLLLSIFWPLLVVTAIIDLLRDRKEQE